MASALQKLFRKRLNKQQQQSQQDDRRQSEVSSSNKSTTAQKRQTISGPSNMLTVSSLNSPSYTSIHRTLSSTSSSGVTNHGHAKDQSCVSNRIHGLNTSDYSNRERQRTNSLGVSSMLREGSYDGRSWRTAGHTGINVDQFGTIIQNDPLAGPMPSPSPSQDHFHEEDELESNEVYETLLSKLSSSSKLANAKVLLIPCNAAIFATKLEDSILDNEQYISLHALSPSNLFKDQYESIRMPVSQLDVSEDPWSRIHLTATLEPESHSVQITLSKMTSADFSKPKHLRRTLKVMSETTVYHSLRTDSRKERIRLRVLILNEIVVSPTVTVKRNSKLAASIASSAKTMTPKVESKFKEDQESSVTFPTRDSQPKDKGGDDSCLVPITRQFLSDFVFLLDPPSSTGPLRGPLKVALEAIERASTEFAMAYIYVPGFDSYNVSRIRGGILGRSWKAFEEARKANGDNERGDEGDIDLTTWLGNDGRARLLLLLENTVMGFCHAKVYGSICAIRHDADDTFDSIVATYHDHGISLSDLGVTNNNSLFRSHALDLAEAVLSCLGDADEDMEHIITDKNVQRIRQMATIGSLPNRFDVFENANKVSSQRMRCRIRTPLDALEVMHATLDEINKAAMQPSRIQSRSESISLTKLGADEVLPVLTYVLIRTAPRKLSSLLYYVRLFGISDATPAKHNWALTTFEAVVRYLADDPLGLSCGSGAARLHNLGKDASVRSAKSSMTSASLGVVDETNVSKWDSMNSKLGENYDRSRRASLPASNIINMNLPYKTVTHANQSSHIDLKSISSSQRGGAMSPAGSILSQDGLMDAEEDGDRTVQTFKRPGKPASALSERLDNYSASKRPSISIWQGENQDTTSGSFKSYSTDGPNVHKRASSVSGDLLIRPQIVMRASNKSREPQHVILNRPLSPQDGSNSSRGASPDLGVRMSASNSQSSHRRRSVDSWASLNNFFYGEANSRFDLSRQPSTSGNVEEESEVTADSPPMSSARSDLLRPSIYKSGVAQSTSWLPTWANDWSNLSRRPSQNSNNDCGTERNDNGSKISLSHPPSVSSHDMGHIDRTNLLSTSSALSQSISNHSGSAIGFPSLDSMPSLEPHETSVLSHENDDATSASSPRDRSSILSSPSSVLSGTGVMTGQSYDQATIKGLRGSWYLNDSAMPSLGKSQSFSVVEQMSPTPRRENKRVKTRTRLLSTSEPSDPLPPRLTTTEAVQILPSLFASQASIAGSSGSGEEAFDNRHSNPKRPKPSSIASADQVSISTIRPARLSSRSKSSDHHQDIRPSRIINQRSSNFDRSTSSIPFGQQNESGIGSLSLSSHTSPPIQFIKLDIPSPVDERADPMATPSSTVFP